jgi:hypothetical protein
VLAVVSRDLRAPLGTVQLVAGLVARLVPENGSPELRRSADAVQRAISPGIDRVKRFSRIVTGALPAGVSPCHIPASALGA